MFVWQAHEGAVTSLAFGPSGQFLISAGADECVKIWEPFAGAEQCCVSLQYPDRTLHQHVQHVPLRWVTLSGDGKQAVVYQYSQRQNYHSQRLVFFDITRKDIAFECPVVNVVALKRTPDGQTIATLNVWIPPENSAEIRFYEFVSPTATALNVDRFASGSQALAFSPDGTRLLIGRTLRTWPLISNERIGYIDTKNYKPEDLVFSADNQHLFALVGGKIVVYSLPDGLFKTKLKGHNGRITAMVLAPDGRRLWTASRDATVKCWDTHSLTLDRTFTFQTGGLDCLAVSPDGNVAAVGSGQKGTITVWDLN